MIRKEKDGVKEVKEIMKRREEATRSFFLSTETERNTGKPGAREENGVLPCWKSRLIG